MRVQLATYLSAIMLLCTKAFTSAYTGVNEIKQTQPPTVNQNVSPIALRSSPVEDYIKIGEQLTLYGALVAALVFLNKKNKELEASKEKQVERLAQQVNDIQAKNTDQVKLMRDNFENHLARKEQIWMEEKNKILDLYENFVNQAIKDLNEKNEAFIKKLLKEKD